MRPAAWGSAACHTRLSPASPVTLLSGWPKVSSNISVPTWPVAPSRCHTAWGQEPHPAPARQDPGVSLCPALQHRHVRCGRWVQVGAGGPWDAWAGADLPLPPCRTGTTSPHPTAPGPSGQLQTWGHRAHYYLDACDAVRTDPDGAVLGHVTGSPRGVSSTHSTQSAQRFTPPALSLTRLGFHTVVVPGP